MQTIKILSVVAGATALIGTLLTFPATAEAARPTTAPVAVPAAASAVVKPLPCRGGSIEVPTPRRSGNRVKATVVAKCAAYPGSRTGRLGARLERLDNGRWRVVYRVPMRVSSAPFVKRLPQGVACASGTDFYRVAAHGWIKEGSGPKRRFSVTGPVAKISC
ncbi:hypothetical protein [Rhizohabitans arisaemae]|uniref:hypothetical protein n=1 Tax=Rhizohabitans arisaemae TaxID=2720610 RepID=UPI0024B1F914|nr:hypothetical protein [Rhizohabitans arisaemae]